MYIIALSAPIVAFIDMFRINAQSGWEVVERRFQSHLGGQHIGLQLLGQQDAIGMEQGEYTLMKVGFGFLGQIVLLPDRRPSINTKLAREPIEFFLFLAFSWAKSDGSDYLCQRTDEHLLHQRIEFGIIYQPSIM